MLAWLIYFKNGSICFISSTILFVVIPMTLSSGHCSACLSSFSAASFCHNMHNASRYMYDNSKYKMWTYCDITRVQLQLTSSTWNTQHMQWLKAITIIVVVMVIPLCVIIASLRSFAIFSLPTFGLLKAEQSDEIVGRLWLGGAHFSHWRSISLK